MKVLHLIKTSVGATWAVRQIRALGELGVDIHVAIPHGPRADDLRSVGAEVHLMQTDLANPNPVIVARRVRALRSLVDTVRPDIVHSHFVGTTMAMRLALRSNRDIPRVFQVPGPLHLESGPFRAAELAVANSEDYWIASCEWTRDRYLRSGVDP